MGLKAVLAVAALTLAGLASPVLAADTATAVLKDKDGKTVGSVTLTDTPNGVLLNVSLTRVPAGDHALHIHGIGKCEPPSFKSAGGHFNPDDKKHGILNPGGPHAGDMPNIHLPDSGKLQIEVLNTRVSLNGGAALLDDDGSALLIHAGADDYKTDPTGEAGGRIACGVVTK